MQELNDSIKDFQKREPVVLPILQYPAELLTKVSKPVVSDIPGDVELQNLLNDMVATMEKTGAVGLAAVQVGRPLRVLVVRNSDGSFTKIINPTLVEISTETERKSEGCMSFLGLFIQVRRPSECVVEFSNERGERVKVAFDGLDARAVQHEIEHLNGETFLNRVPNIERSNALAKNKVMKRRVSAMIKRVRSQ